ncbi:hypothetical protein [Hoeflea olei]|nr:hypothetical protein [Hoeflea olei]
MKTHADADLTPDQVSEHETMARDEKLSRLAEMKHDLERQSARGTADLDQVEARAAALKRAMERAKSGT